MMVKIINEHGIENYIDPKELIIGNMTLLDLQKEVIKLQNTSKSKEQKEKSKEEKLSKLWDKIK